MHRPGEPPDPVVELPPGPLAIATHSRNLICSGLHRSAHELRYLRHAASSLAPPAHHIGERVGNDLTSRGDQIDKSASQLRG
jgi:hypothetical protein